MRIFHHPALYPRHDVQMIPTARRLAVIPHFFFGVMTCIGVFVDERQKISPVYDSLFEYIPLEVWAIGFALSAIAAVWTMTNGAYHAYVTCNLIMLMLSVSWTIALTKARFIDHLGVSALGFGLWIFVVLTCLVNAAIPVSVTYVEGRRERG